MHYTTDRKFISTLFHWFTFLSLLCYNSVTHDGVTLTDSQELCIEIE